MGIMAASETTQNICVPREACSSGRINNASALPIPERFGADPAPDNGFSRVLALLGPKAKPLLDRVATGAFPAWAKAAAAWARDHAVDAPQ